jgi:hypothetical protein
MSDNTYGGLIEKAMRILTPTAIERTLQVITNYTAASGVLVVDYNNPAFSSIRPGTILSVGLNVFLVQNITNAGTGTLQVIGGYQGSTDVNITGSCTAATSTCYIRPKFTRFDVSVAINDELEALSAPDVGLGQIRTVDVTWAPPFVGYSLPAAFDQSSSYVLAINITEPLPLKRNPQIRRGQYRVLRNQSTSQFTNGAGIVLYRAGWPGFSIRVEYLAPFCDLVNLSDDVLTVAGVPYSAQDLVAMGAALRLAPDREIQRNTMSAQPDPRKAPEVPPNAIQGSTNSLMAKYLRRISQEQSRLRRNYPQAER